MLDEAGSFNSDELEVPALLLLDVAARWRFLDDFEAYTTIQNAAINSKLYPRLSFWCPVPMPFSDHARAQMAAATLRAH